MRRRAIVAFALVASLLVVAAQPAAASHGPIVVSQHTTDTDFADATLDNMTVVGSGESATVEIETTQEPTVIDSFEDGDLSEYSVENPTGGSASVTSARSFDGSQSLKHDTDGVGSHDIYSTSGLSDYPAAGDNVTVWLRAGNSADVVMFHFGVQSTNPHDNNYRVQLRDNGDGFQLEKIDGGTRTLLASDTTFSVPTGDWAKLEINWSTSGDITVTAFDTGGNQISTISATDTTFTSGGIGFGHDNHDSLQTTVHFDFAVISSELNDVKKTPASYESPNHTVEQSEKSWFDITQNTNATVTITSEAWNGTAWVQLAQQSGITATGNHTLTWSPSPHDTVRNRVLVENDTNNGEPAFALADESVGFTASEPNLDNSSATPTGTLTTATPTFEIDVNDSDFPLAQSDQVIAELFVDGSSKGTDTLTSNGTASVSLSEPLTGGDHTYHWVASDSYGHSTTSDTFSITVPSQLTIRNETSPYNVVQGCNAVVRFFEDADTDPTIVERTDDDGDGNVSLAGLPTGTEFTATVKCGGYHNRTALIDSLFEQQSVFLLAKDRPAVENRFTVEDNTGEFPATSTEIIIQKAINRSKYGGSPANFSWTTVSGDDLGADQAFVVDLEDEDRYRILVRNEAGETRVLGAYVPETTGTIPLTIGQVSISGDTQAGTAFGATLRDLENGRDVQLFYYDSQDATTELDILIYNKSDPSDELLNTTITDPTQRHVETQPIPSDAPDDVTYVVQVNATRSGHPDVSFEAEVGAVGKLFADLPMDQQVLSLIGWVIWFAGTAWVALRSPMAAPAFSTLLATVGTFLGVFFVHPAILGMMAAISVLVLAAGVNP